MFDNPYIKNKKLFLAYTLFFIVIGAMDMYAAFSTNMMEMPFSDYIQVELVYFVLYYIIGISLWYYAAYLNFEKFSPLKIILNHLAAAVFTTLFWIMSGYFLLTYVLPFSEKSLPELRSNVIFPLTSGFFIYIFIQLINYLIIYYKNYQDNKIREVELHSLVQEAELRSLKYQINPHFIFNSLNSISSLTMSFPERAQDMTIKLSEYLRRTLSKNDNQMVPLSEEIKNVSLYLDIERVRFEDKFEFIKEINLECEKITVPSMLLQPLFENAIKHGVYESLDKIVIQFRCKKENEFLKIEVLNNYDPEAIPRKGEGIGLKNIKNRLKLVYKMDNLITVSDSKQIFQVTIYIPLRGDYDKK